MHNFARSNGFAIRWPINYESISQFCIETIHERQMRKWSLLVCLSEYLPLHSVYILHGYDIIKFRVDRFHDRQRRHFPPFSAEFLE